MANKDLFNNSGNKAKNTPPANTVNNAGGKAYLREERHLLAQLAATNCFNGTFYSSPEDSLKLVKNAVAALSKNPEFIAKTALYARRFAHMKDMPAFLCVALSELDSNLFRKVFRAVVTNGKMLRNVIQMARSGSVTSKPANMSSGTWRHAIQEFFNTHTEEDLFRASIGNDPSMRDILRMSHPKPNTPQKEALFGYFVGKEVSESKLPPLVKQFEQYKKTKKGPLPDVDFRFLTALELDAKDWKEIARNAPWTMTRMNLNTFARHNVFSSEELVKVVRDRLRNEDLIKKAKAFPYQLFVAWKETSKNSEVPFAVSDALQDAMEIAIDNIPVLPGNGLICVDQSGSMDSAVTGNRKGATSTVRCADVAGLIASAVLRKNKSAEVYTFSDTAVKVNINPRDTVMTNTTKLNTAGGGTNISAPLVKFNQDKKKADWILYVSDNESWLDNSRGYGATSLTSEWENFKSRNPQAKLICCDLAPYATTQITERPNVLQVGGWSDACFDVMASFLQYGHQTDHWVNVIEKISLDSVDLPKD